MLIGLCGATCAGKSTVAEYLIEEHGFRRLYLLEQETSSMALMTLNEHANVDSYTPTGSEKKRMSTVPRGKISKTFSTPEALLDFVTMNWRQKWVTTDIHNENVVDVLQRRPAFLLVSVDAPIITRWERHKTRAHYSAGKQSALSLEDFVHKADEQLYAPHTGLAGIQNRAQLNLVNSTSSLDALYMALTSLDLPNEERLRPGWDLYFMQLADLAALRSNCMKRRVGCVLAQGKRVVSTGYNGTPRGMKNCNEGGCPRCNSSGNKAGAALDTCLCLHAEENALLEAGRERIRDGSILYCNTCPCLTCSVKIAQVGISEVVYSTGYHLDSAAAAIFEEAGVKLRQFSPPREGLIHLQTISDLG